MATTTNMGLPYPTATQPPDVAGDIFALANKIDHLQTAWTPTIDGIGNSAEVGGAYMRVGGYCIAHGYVRVADGQYPSGGSNYLNLPIPSAGISGIATTVGTLDILRRSDGARVFGRVLQAVAFSTNASKALLFADNVPSGGGGYIGTAAMVSGVPFTISGSDAMYLNFRLLYPVGV